jgi:REP element-mobilizing transposase RayT
MPLFPEWEQAHAEEIKEMEALPDRIKKMWRTHGKREDATCGNCQKLRAFDYYNKRYYKCDLYGVSHGAGTDWRKRWTACGRFVRES